MGYEIAIVLGLLLAAVGLFATRALPVDLVTIFLLLALVLTGILEPTEAFAGFSSQIIIILGSIFVINGALLEGRVLDLVSAWLLRVAGGSVNKLQLTTMSVVGGLSGFMNNTAVTSLFIGPTMSIARKLKTSPSKLLMPVCFASILGGTCTLIGTSTNVAVSGEIAKQHQADLAKWVANGGTDLNGDGTTDAADYLQYAEAKNLKIYKPLGLFEITPVGWLIMGVGIAYLMLFGRRLLPDYPDESLAEGIQHSRVPLRDCCDAGFAADRPACVRVVAGGDGVSHRQNPSQETQLCSKHPVCHRGGRSCCWSPAAWRT